MLADAVVNEELVGCGAGGVAAGLGAHKDLGSYYIYRFGNDEQRKRWLVPSIQGKSIGALGVTEPNAGSDGANLGTKAVRDGDSHGINGPEEFITHRPQAPLRSGARPKGGE